MVSIEGTYFSAGDQALPLYLPLFLPGSFSALALHKFLVLSKGQGSRIP